MSWIFYYAECHYAKCPIAECHYAKRLYPECHGAQLCLMIEKLFYQIYFEDYLYDDQES